MGKQSLNPLPASATLLARSSLALLLRERIHIALVDHKRSRVNKGGNWRGCVLCPISVERYGRVVMEVIEQLRPVVTHREGFLRDGRGDDPFPDPVDRTLVRIHRDDRDLPAHILPVHHFAYFRARTCLEAD